ncbi:efflux transporter outer membrane subunit [Niveibacterium sp. SC-1]|uniref:efflux transporter outer membrane subunit n=1 Tax=Niveibacterium sp. SC-1 TaxID=3135646 RepID=UPI00311D5F3F
MRSPSLLLVSLALGACALPSPPAREQLQHDAMPEVRLPAEWQSPAIAGEVRQSWFARFDDPALNALIEEALAHNLDLPVAASRIEQAAAAVKAAGATLVPNVVAYGRAGGKMSDGSGLTGFGLNVSWELDLWGRVRAGREASRAQYAATEADYAWAQQSIAAGVARAWFVTIEARAQRALVQELIKTQQAQLDLARSRARVGNADLTPVVQLESALAGSRDSERQLALAQNQAQRGLEVLLGRYPSGTIETPDRFKPLPPDLPAGLPASLLERRPDLLAAERRVAIAFYRTTEAKAARLPSLKLTAGVNSISSDLFVLKDRDNPVWSAGLGLLAPIYMGGALEAQVEARTAEQKQALAAYGQAGLKALSEVEDALASNIALHDRADLLVQQESASKRLIELAEKRLQVGSADRRNILNEELNLLNVRANLLRIQSEARVQRVNLHLALGGDFTPPAQP